MKLRIQLRVWKVIFTSACLAIATSAGGQTNISFQYFYDDLGQLTKVLDSTGSVVEYVYDPVGNILQIKRSSAAPGTLAIFSFTPQRGGPGQTVTIQGQGFDPIPANDIVQFNGTTAPVLSASPTTLTVTVPAAATTGPISVIVSRQTATSTTSFTVLPVPVITSLNRKSALLGATFPNAKFPALTVTGSNLTDSTFSFAPAANPPVAILGTPTSDPSGMSATMSLTVGTSTTGTFALIATNIAGSSSAIPTSANRFTVVDPRSTADTDGDGIPDAVEAIFGTDPLDPTSSPLIPSLPGQAQSVAVSVLNTSSRGANPVSFESESPAVSVLNGSFGPAVHEVESPAVAVLNSNPTGTPRTFEWASPAVTLLNGNPGQSAHEAESPAVTVSNTATKAAIPAVPPATEARKRGRSPSIKRRALQERTRGRTAEDNIQKPSSARATSNEKQTANKSSTEPNNQPGVEHVNQNRY